jgi:filamentous hemagglutinin
MALASMAIGGAVGGGNGATTALQGELYNRQLHDWEHDLAKALAEKSDGKYSQQEIEDALRNSSYGSSDAPVVDFGMGDNTRYSDVYVPAGTGEVMLSWQFYGQSGSSLDSGASFSFSPSQSNSYFGFQNDAVATQVMPSLNYDVANFIASNINDPSIQASFAGQFASTYGNWQYSWQKPQAAPSVASTGYVPQQQGVRGNSETFYDTLLGRGVTIGVNGVCATAECVIYGGNWNLQDQRTQQYIGDVSHAQMAGMVAATSGAIGLGWASLADAALVPSWLAYGGAGATSAAANVAGQYAQTGEVRAPDVLIAALAGTTVGWAARLPGWQAPLATMMINTSASGANTWLDNIVYGESSSIPNAMLSSGFGTAIGYRIGDGMGNKGAGPLVINLVANPVTEGATRAGGAGVTYLNSLSSSSQQQSNGNSRDIK